MPNYFSPNEIQPKGPTTCSCIPVKYFLALLHILGILIATNFAIIAPYYFPYSMFPPFYFVIVFAAFNFGYIRVMVVHLVLACIMFPVALASLFTGVFGFFYFLFNDPRDFRGDWIEFVAENMEYGQLYMSSLALVFGCLFLIFVFFWYVYYLKNCYIYIKHVQTKKQAMSAQPEFDTTQGIYHFNETAYDGKEYSAMYPNL